MKKSIESNNVKPRKPASVLLSDSDTDTEFIKKLTNNMKESNKAYNISNNKDLLKVGKSKEIALFSDDSD